MANVSNANQTERKVPILALVKANIWLIIIIVILGIVGGYCVGKVKAKTSYTASRAVILRMTTSVDLDASETINNATLVKLYLPMVVKLLKEDVIIVKANEIYRENKGIEDETQYFISGGSVGTSYNEDSLIFTMSYTDSNIIDAEEKLECLTKGFNEIMANDSENDYLEANNVSLEDLDNGRFQTSSSNGFRSYLVMGTIIGIVVAVVIVGLKYVFDNTVKSKEEFEELTGINVFASIKKF